MHLSWGQLSLLEQLTIDLSKGLLLTTLASPLVSSSVSFLITTKTFVLACFFMYLSLKITEQKESLV